MKNSPVIIWQKYHRNSLNLVLRFFRDRVSCYQQTLQYKWSHFYKNIDLCHVSYFETNHQCIAILSCSSIFPYRASCLEKNLLRIAMNLSISIFLDRVVFLRILRLHSLHHLAYVDEIYDHAYDQFSAIYYEFDNSCLKHLNYNYKLAKPNREIIKYSQICILIKVLSNLIIYKYGIGIIQPRKIRNTSN